MILDNVKVYRYDLPLKHPLFLKGEKHKIRSGLILKIINKDGVFGLGEIAPLPGFSEETIEEAKAQLVSLLREYQTKPLGNIGEITQELLPSVAFGIETTLISLSANTKQFSFSSLVNRDAKPTVPINALLWGEPDQIIKRIELLAPHRIRSYKLKIGSKPFKDEIKIIDQVLSLLGDDKLLRLDANRAYDYKTGAGLIEYAFSKKVEYVEEPFAELEQLTGYLTSGDHPHMIALDESLRLSGRNQIDGFEKAGAVILKPTMTGYLKSMALAAQAFQNQMKVIISSSFESALGLYHLASIAAIVNGDKFDYAAGLNTYEHFENNLFDFSKYVTNDHFDLNEAFEVYNLIDWSKLKELDYA